MENGTEVRKRQMWFYQSFFLFVCFMLYWHLSVYNVGHPNAQSAIKAKNHECAYACICC